MNLLRFGQGDFAQRKESSPPERDYYECNQPGLPQAFFLDLHDIDHSILSHGMESFVNYMLRFSRRQASRAVSKSCRSTIRAGHGIVTMG
ncbi:hypothetical protein QNO07_26905, partial [Streptomyces sp. 549]|uniref:hypothetical protein n=1 Tax=Streptomyces sp. 549 TaxID=3049076 RepID=UPI0024C2BC28